MVNIKDVIKDGHVDKEALISLIKEYLLKQKAYSKGIKSIDEIMD